MNYKRWSDDNANETSEPADGFMSYEIQCVPLTTEPGILLIILYCKEI